jgi:hypothetical protein
VLGTVLRDDRGDSPHQLVSRVVLVRTPHVLGFWFFLLGFCLRDLLLIPIESALVDAGVVLICYFGLYCHIIFIYYYFVYSAWLYLFF